LFIFWFSVFWYVLSVLLLFVFICFLKG
jgi:hypothetical protein